MNRRIINPWRWQDKYGFVQANEVANSQRTLYCAGITSVDTEGNAMYKGDMRGQVAQALDNIEILLEQAGFGFSDIMRLNIYTTDMVELMKIHDYITARLGEAGCRHAGTLLGISSLASPDLMVEIEVTAAA